MSIGGVKQSEAEKIAHEKLRDVGLDESYCKRLPAMLDDIAKKLAAWVVERGDEPMASYAVYW